MEPNGRRNISNYRLFHTYLVLDLLRARQLPG